MHRSGHNNCKHRGVLSGQPWENTAMFSCHSHQGYIPHAQRCVWCCEAGAPLVSTTKHKGKRATVTCISVTESAQPQLAHPFLTFSSLLAINSIALDAVSVATAIRRGTRTSTVACERLPSTQKCTITTVMTVIWTILMVKVAYPRGNLCYTSVT